MLEERICSEHAISTYIKCTSDSYNGIIWALTALLSDLMEFALVPCKWSALLSAHAWKRQHIEIEFHLTIECVLACFIIIITTTLRCWILFYYHVLHYMKKSPLYHKEIKYKMRIKNTINIVMVTENKNSSMKTCCVRWYDEW